MGLVCTPIYERPESDIVDYAQVEDLPPSPCDPAQAVIASPAGRDSPAGPIAIIVFRRRE